MRPLARAVLGVAAIPLCLAAPAQNFINTAIARTVELGGATTSLTTQYSVRSLVDSPGEYHLALSGLGGEESAWWEVKVGDVVLNSGASFEDGAPTIKVPIAGIKKDSTTTISLTTTLTHSSSPLPASIAQTESQFLLWQTNSTYVDSWYETEVERIKIRSPTPNILSYPSIPETYTRDNVVTRAGATLTLGPFYNLPRTLGSGQVAKQSAFSVHYEHKEAVVGLRSLKRGVEVSHWGANVNVQDEMALVNMGPRLKGQFSRLAHQQSRFHATSPPQILADLTLRLPPQAHSVYYYDTIGNVSTSRFRPGTPAVPAISGKKQRTQRTVDGTLELKPRYPLLGGWNYTFIVGYDQPLGDVLKVDGSKRVLGVPFLTGVKDLIVDDVELRIVLPEGAKDIQVETPFRVDSITHSTFKTYLDTTGRHEITIRKSRCTENHAQTVYVTYTYPAIALLQKPLAVTAVVAGLFVLAMGLRRVDYIIERRIK